MSGTAANDVFCEGSDAPSVCRRFLGLGYKKAGNDFQHGLVLRRARLHPFQEEGCVSADVWFRQESNQPIRVERRDGVGKIGHAPYAARTGRTRIHLAQGVGRPPYRSRRPTSRRAPPERSRRTLCTSLTLVQSGGPSAGGATFFTVSVTAYFRERVLTCAWGLARQRISGREPRAPSSSVRPERRGEAVLRFVSCLFSRKSL